MPTFYDNVPLVECEYTLTEDEYVKALKSVFFKSAAGKIDVVLLVLGVFLVVLGAYYPLNGYSLAGENLSVVLFASTVGAGCILRVLVRWFFVNKRTAKEIFDTCKVLKAPRKTYVYRDSLVVKNEYVELTKYYSKS